MTATPIIAYKGFDSDFRCRGFQFEVGKTYTHDGEVRTCNSGFHACENPFDVWDYHSVVAEDGRPARFAEVEMSGFTSRDGNEIAAAQITIKAELLISDFVRRAVDAVISATKGKDQSSSGDNAQIGSIGDNAQIGSSGDNAQIGSSGDNAQIGSSGDNARIGSSGYRARIGSSGYRARIGSSGYRAQIGSSGYDVRIGSSGYRAQIGSSGNRAQISSTGADTVVAVAGRDARVQGAVGTWISLASFDRTGKCQGFATGCVGQNGIKAATWYRAENCILMEVAT
jgi:hypothetical protein